MSVKAILRNARIALCLNQREFGELLGLSHSAIWLYESGRRQPALKTIRRIVDVLKEKQIDINYVDLQQPLGEHKDEK